MTLDYGNYDIFLIMGNAGFISSTVGRYFLCWGPDAWKCTSCFEVKSWTKGLIAHLLLVPPWVFPPGSTLAHDLLLTIIVRIVVVVVAVVVVAAAGVVVVTSSSRRRGGGSGRGGSSSSR